jgi:TolB-like protein/formylglycine-generating enzyme required for sulfatase activity/dienelactone hydrolase
MSLFAELRQRKVFRVAAAYAVVAWLLIQVADVVLPALKLPEWTLTFTTILLLLGFPLALVLAWTFELVRDRGGARPSAAAASAMPTVAVLPFANMSDDTAQAHFADGLVEDILTRLQAIEALKVVSRQSTFAYRSRSADARTIARELGCGYLLEGSVRRIDDRMRVTVQLIDAAYDRHLWAERYDRKLTDAFALQDEICDQVVSAVESRLVLAGRPAGADSGGADGSQPAAGRRRSKTVRLIGSGWTIPVLLALVGMAGLLTWTWQQRSEERWAREQALPELEALVAKDDYMAAFDLAQRIASVVPEDPQLRALEPRYAARVRLATDPPGAKVWFRPYDGPETDWRLLGETPLEDLSVPIGFGLWRFEHPERGETLRVFRNPSVELQSVKDPDLVAMFQGTDRTVQLADAATTPPGMVMVPATEWPVTPVSKGTPVELPAYYLDRAEVTNTEYKEFVDAGGYREASYWQDLPFGETATTWQDAVAQFVDVTGRPGPSTWESGSYLDGTGAQPVAGISWFEAMAYARFRGKELPTAYHWYRAAYSLQELLDSISSAVVVRSNFAGKGPAPAGTHAGVGPYGTVDMAGNVREWLWTPIGDTRVIAGGAWNEPPYMYNNVDSASPWDRSAGNGLRCMRTVSGGPIGSALREAIEVKTIDYAALEPVDDAAYAVLAAQLDYSKAGLDPQVEELPSTNAAWTRERISLRTGYDEERFNVQLLLPTSGRAPYQAIVYFPHSGNMNYAQPSYDFNPVDTNQPLDFLLKSGRALVVIAFDDGFERRWPGSRRNAMTREERYRLRLRHHRQDLGRTLDYLATRKDIDSSRIGMLGISYGAQVMMPLLAVEPRVGASVLIGGGIFFLPGLPAAEQPFNALPRITQPILMLSGRWDIDVNTESQEAMFRLLGTPADRKQRIVFDAGHGWLPQNQFVRATLDWYDDYLGPTQ